MNVCVHTHIHIRVGGENDRVYVSVERMVECMSLCKCKETLLQFDNFILDILHSSSPVSHKSPKNDGSSNFGSTVKKQLNQTLLLKLKLLFWEKDDLRFSVCQHLLINRLH